MASSVFFDGPSDEYIDIGAPIDGVSTFTIAYWVNYKSSLPTTVVGGSSDTGALQPGLLVGFYDGVKIVLASNAKYIKSVITPSLDTWYHYAWTFSGGTNLLAGSLFYENGVSKTLADHVQGTQNPGNVDTSSFGYKIGRWKATGASNVMDGEISQFQMFNRVLSQAEVQEIMYNPFGIVNGIGTHNPLWGPAANYVKDVSGNGFNGTATGTSASGKGPGVFFP